MRLDVTQVWRNCLLYCGPRGALYAKVTDLIFKRIGWVFNPSVRVFSPETRALGAPSGASRRVSGRLGWQTRFFVALFCWNYVPSRRQRVGTERNQTRDFANKTKNHNIPQKTGGLPRKKGGRGCAVVAATLCVMHFHFLAFCRRGTGECHFSEICQKVTLRWTGSSFTTHYPFSPKFRGLVSICADSHLLFGLKSECAWF
jgi:hypothetical protein